MQQRILLLSLLLWLYSIQCIHKIKAVAAASNELDKLPIGIEMRADTKINTQNHIQTESIFSRRDIALFVLLSPYFICID